jgi:hypothetical protein
MNRVHDGIASSNVLGRLNMQFDLVAMSPDVPSDFPEFHDERGGPTFASVASAEPDEVGFLNACPFGRDAALKECKPPEMVLGVNSFE